jgi:hypothetical protein
MIIIRRKLFLVVLLMSFFGVASVAEPQNDNRTIRETILFLIEKTEWIREFGTRQPNSSRAWKLGNPTRCELVWSTSKRNPRSSRRNVRGGKPTVQTTVSASIAINLSDFDPSRVWAGATTFTTGIGTLSNQAVFMKTTNEMKVVRWSGYGGNFTTESLTIHFDTAEQATTYGNAIRQAVTLCGGKVSSENGQF